MIDAPQEDQDRLAAALDMLRAPVDPVSALGRDIMTGTGMRALDMLIAEADRTVLRRELQFTNARNETLVLDVSERRVLRVSAPGAPWTALSPKNEKSLAASAEVARAFCDNSDRLHVLSRIVSDDDAGLEIGVPARALRSQGNAGTDAAFNGRAFAEAVHDTALACARVQDATVVDSWGSEDLLERIKLSLAQGITPSRPMSLWVNRSAQGICFGYVQGGRESVWVVSHRKDAQRISAAWGALMRGET